MIHILHGFSNVGKEFKPEGLRQDVHYIESPRTKRRIVGWLIGCLRALYQSKSNETIICWYDFQAIIIYWICFLTFQHRKIGCLNLLLKKKDTIVNNIVSKMYKKALISKDFHASVTSPYYGEKLKEWLNIEFDYTVIHDPYHETWERECNAPNNKIFVGGGNARDWSFILRVANQMPDVQFTFAMDTASYAVYKKEAAPNVNIKYNLTFSLFLEEMANSAIVCIPLNTEAPAGLLVLFQAGGSKRFVIITNTVTTQEYIPSERGCTLRRNADEWVKSIYYYLEHKEERQAKAQALHIFLKNECSKEKFDKGIQQLINLCESKN